MKSRSSIVRSRALQSTAILVLVCGSVAGLTTPQAMGQAQLFWDQNGATAGTGGTGTWNATTATNWRNGSETGALQAWATGNIAVLGGTVGTLTMGVATTANGITVLGTSTGTNYAITTSATNLLSLSADAPINIAAGKSLTFTGAGFGSVLGGTVTTIIQGGGTMNITGANRLFPGSFRTTGATTTLVINGTNALDNGSASTGIDARNGSVIRINGTNNYRRTATLDGATLELGSIRTFQAQTNNFLTVNTAAGTRSIVQSVTTGEIGGLAGNGSTARVVTINSTGDSGGVDLEYRAGWRNGTFNKAGAGTLWLTSTAIFNRNDNYTTASNTSSSLVINAGSVLNEGTILSPVTVNNNGTLRNGATTGIFDQVEVNTGGVFEISRISGLFNGGFAHATGKGDINLAGGTLRYATGFTGDVSAALAAIPSTGGSLDTNGNDVTFASPLTGTGTLTKKGSGILTLEAANTLSGLVIEAGALEIGPFASVSGMNLLLKSTGQIEAAGGGVFNGAVLANEFVSGGRSVSDVVGDFSVATGSIIRPGGTGQDFEMNFSGDLELDGTYEVDVTAFTPDRINVAGDLDLSQASITLNLTAPGPSGGIIASYGGTLTGTPAISGFITGSRYAPALVHDSVAKTIELTLSATEAPLALTWNGDAGSEWDLTTTQQNFTRTIGGTPDTFKQLDLVTFGNPTGTTNVTLTGALAPGSLNFNHTVDYTLSGTGGIAGTTSLIKDGAGILNLLTDNSYSGGTTITAGQIHVGNGGGTGSLGTGAIVNNATLAINRSGTLAIPGAVSGTGSISFNGGGLFTLGETNSYSGGTSVLGGTLRQGKAGAIPVPSAGSATVTVSSGATLDLGGFALAGTLARPVLVSGPGTSATSGAVMNGGTGLFNTGVNFLALAGDTSIGNDGSRFDIVGTAGAGGIISPDLTPRKLTKVGNNQISLKTDDYSGVSEFIVNGGTLGVEFDGFSSPTRTVTLNAGGALSLWGGRNLINPFVMNGGTLRSDNATTNIVAGNIELTTDSVFSGATSTGFTASGVISGAGRLTKDGAGDVTLTNANTYTGGTTLLGTGRLLITHSDALGSAGSVQLAGGAASQLTLAAAGLSLSRPVTILSGGRIGEGTIFANQTGVTTMAGDVTVSGAHNAGGTFGSIAGGELVISGKITQSVLGLDPLQPTLTNPVRIAHRNGTSTFANAANDFRWLYVSENTIKLGVTNGLPTGAILSLGDNTAASIFEMNGFNQEIRSLSRWSSTGTTTIRNTGASPSELTFDTDFSGLLQMESVLAIGTASIDGSVAVTVTSAAFGSPIELDVPVLAGDTNDVWAGKVRAALAANTTIIAVYDVVGTGNQISLLRKVGAANDATLNIALANGGVSPGITADATSENALPGVSPFYSGAITGDVSLRKTGPETLTLSGTHTHTGTTTVQEGKLIYNGTHTGGGGYSVAAGSTLAGNGTTASTVDVAGVIAPGDVAVMAPLRVGGLDMDNGSSLLVDINSTDVSSDYLRSTGNVNLTGSVSVSFTDLNPNAALPLGSKLYVLGYTGTMAGTFISGGNPVPDDSVLQIGPNYFRLDYNDTGSDTPLAVTLTSVAAPGGAYETWMSGYPSIPEGQRGKGIDADGDGRINLLEFGLGTDPSLASSSPNHQPYLFEGTGSNLHLAITIPVRAGAVFAGSPPAASRDGVNYTIEGSENLSSFTAAVEEIANPGGLPVASAGYEFKTFRLVNPTSSLNKGFLRVRVTESTP